MTESDFERIPVLRKLIAHELAEIGIAYEQATNISVKLSGMPHGGGNHSVVENAVVRADVHYQKYVLYQAELDEIFARMEKESAKLTDAQKEVMEMYYKECKKVGAIAREKGLSERHVFRLKKEAIERLCFLR